jgi:hypothetical protein
VDSEAAEDFVEWVAMEGGVKPGSNCCNGGGEKPGSNCCKFGGYCMHEF